MRKCILIFQILTFKKCFVPLLKLITHSMLYNILKITNLKNHILLLLFYYFDYCYYCYYLYNLYYYFFNSISIVSTIIINKCINITLISIFFL